MEYKEEENIEEELKGIKKKIYVVFSPVLFSFVVFSIIGFIDKTLLNFSQTVWYFIFSIYLLVSIFVLIYSIKLIKIKEKFIGTIFLIMAICVIIYTIVTLIMGLSTTS